VSTGARLRVLQVITRLSGGAGVMCVRGAAALRELDPERYEVTIVTGSGGRLLAEAEAAGMATVVEPALRAPVSPVWDAVAQRRLRRIVGGQFDVVHTHCAKAGALGRLAAARAGTRTVHTYHGFPFHAFQPAPLRAAYAGIERGLGRITDVGLCVGRGVAAEAARRRLLPPERIRTTGVPVALDAPVIAPASRARVRASLGLPREATVVGVVGRVTYQKAPEDFVAALRALARPGVVGVWIGDGDLAGRLATLAAPELRDGRIVLTGERADVTDLLPAFDVFALPSRYEGLPLAIVEAMVAGVPVVATDVGAVSDVVVHGETGLLVPPRRPERLAAAIRRRLDEPALVTRMAAAARQRLGEAHTPAALGNVLAAAYTGAAIAEMTPVAAA
jgi:glycosyltransferase involved in cell wall biosynthesis